MIERITDFREHVFGHLVYTFIGRGQEFQVSDPLSPLDGLGCCSAECDAMVEAKFETQACRRSGGASGTLGPRVRLSAERDDPTVACVRHSFSFAKKNAPAALATNRECLRIDSGINGELFQLVAIRHELFQREFMGGCKFPLAPTHQAAILRYLCKATPEAPWDCRTWASPGTDFSKTSCIVSSGSSLCPQTRMLNEKNAFSTQRECLFHTGVVSTLQQLHRLFNSARIA